MKRHHLSFDGYPLDTAIAIRKYVDQLRGHIETHPEAERVVIAALAETFAFIAGDAVERKTLPSEVVRALITEQRVVIQRRIERPALSKLEFCVLSSIAHASEPATMRKLEERTHLPRTTIESATRSLMIKKKLTRAPDAAGRATFTATGDGREAVGPAPTDESALETPKTYKRGARL